MVLFHTSLRSFGHVEGGAMGLIQALFDAVGPEGTLVAPTLTGSRTDGPDHPPVFDRDRTPCWTGRVPETFRQLPGALRSLHPTHSVTAIGRRAAWLIDGHLEAPSPCGIRTPYARLASEGGQVVLFGVDFESCTLVHSIEEVAGVPYHLQDVLTPVSIRAGGARLERSLRLHVWDDRFKDFNRLAPPLKAAGGMRQGLIGSSLTTVIDAEILWSVGVALLRRDPLYLVRESGSDEASG
jgi:aminoglycoside 3-N-acetyltransferase